MTRPIVAGVDGSASALHAVRWAAREAERRHVPLRLVHVGPSVPPAPPDQIRDRLGVAEAAARQVAGSVEVGTDLRDGPVATVLIEESAAARLVVLGSRGLGGFGELLVGSIAAAVSAHGHCPVVVTRSSTVDAAPPETGPVVVGVDGSPLSDAAVEFAFEQASMRGSELVAVHAWADTVIEILLAEGLTAWDFAPAELHATEILAERLAGWQEKHPNVEVRRVVARDRPAHALLAEGKDAQLLVVGSRGRGPLTGLGSVSQTLLHHAECPVAIIRAGRE